MNLEKQFLEGLSALDLTLEVQQTALFFEYLQLLEKWNKNYNLTAITDPQKVLTHHLLDSLSIHSWFKKDCKIVLDVGSGAGFPGFPLAIALPDIEWVLLDSNGKKTRFIQQAVAKCRVRNVRVVKSRVEDYDAPDPLDIIVTRAYASLDNFAKSVEHLMQPGTLLLAMKTGMEDEEPTVFKANEYDSQVYDLRVPGLPATRQLVTVRQR